MAWFLCGRLSMHLLLEVRSVGDFNPCGALTLRSVAFFEASRNRDDRWATTIFIANCYFI